MAIKKIKITIKSLEDSFKESRKVAREIDRGIFKKHTPIINFTDFKTYKKMLTEKRLELLSTIRFKKPETIKQLSIITQRDFKNVYDDVKMIETIGLLKLKKTNLGLMPVVLYDEIDIDIKIPLEMISR